MWRPIRSLTTAATFVLLRGFEPSYALGFGPATSYSVGTGPTGIVVGDFNGDGKPDIAVANSGSANISVLLGNGDGTFRSAMDSGAGQIPSALAAADLDGDGHLDLAIADQAGAIIVMLGKGDGTFYLPVAIPLDASPRSIAVSDFNGDGKMDLAVGQFDVSTTTGHVSILLGNGDGTFGSPVNFALAGAIPYGLVVTDFNGDHNADIAATSFSPGVSILLGNGDGTFQNVQSFSLPKGNSTYSLAVSDFDHDGKPDLFVTNQKFCLSQPCPFNGVAVLLGNGDGNFRSTSVPNDTAAYNKATISGVADFDGDGNPDLALSTWDGVTGSVLIVPGNGDGTFRNPIRMTIGTNPVGVAAADFNGDGLLDLAAPLVSDNVVVVMLNSNTNSVFMLSVVNLGSGTGTVSTNPPGILCGTSCSATFPGGTQLSLTAVPASGSVFSGWAGNCGGLDPNNCVITLNSNQSVNATFNLASDFAMTAASSTLTVNRGSLATDALTFAAQGGFSGTISLTCTVSGPLPKPNCSVSPVSVSPGNTATLTVDASTLTAGGKESQFWGGFGLLCTAVLPIPILSYCCVLPYGRKRPPGWLLCCLFVGIVIVGGACGGGSNSPGRNPPAAGGSSPTYVVTVSATSGSLLHSSTISVTVQ
jgi:hypothetical protein